MSASDPSTATPTGGRYSSSHMESSVTRLLVATKMLLEALTKWSIGQRSEEQVSDVYVRLGNDFNTAKIAFGSYGIDMSDLESIPDDLRYCLETCLSEEASPAVLELHLPRVREIIISLLQGLKLKQAEYKQFLLRNRTSATPQTPANMPQSIPPQQAQSLPAPQAQLRTQQPAQPQSQLQPPVPPIPTQHEASPSLIRGASAGPTVHRKTENKTRSMRQGASDGTPPVPQYPLMEDRSSPRDSLLQGSSKRPLHAPPVEASSRMSQQTFRGHVTKPSMDRTPAPPEIIRHTLTDTPLSNASSADLDSPSVAARSRHAPSLSLPTHSQMDKVGAGSTRSNGSTSSGSSSNRSPLPTIEASSPLSIEGLEAASDPSLRALKSRDALERRASKRFSAYTFNKMGIGQGFGSSFGTGNLGMSMLSLGATPSAPAASTPAPAERKSGSTKRPSRLNVVNNNADISNSPGSADSSMTVPSPRPERAPKSAKRTSSQPDSRQNSLKVPMETTSASSSTESLPFVDAPIEEVPAEVETTAIAATTPAAASVSTPTQATYPTPTAPPAIVASAPPKGPINVFLQLGRHTRKATIDYRPGLPAGGITIATLRMLFVDRFAYSPGQENFPAIYVKDPQSGVSYELENLEDVQNETMLTLNIEPLDQVKQHLDLTLGGLTRELRELKAAFIDREREREQNRRISTYAHVAENNVASDRKISDSEFAAAGQRMGRASSGGGARVADDFKHQYDELLKLRRELAIMRQVQQDFQGDMSTLFKDLRAQNKRVREIAAADKPVERNFIIAGKAHLDSTSQEILTLVEDLQDSVDDLKLDVIQRGVKPKPAAMKKIISDVERTTRGLEEVEKYVQSVKPSWKKTWETELQSIVEEQEFLNHQESLIADLRDDHAALQDVLNDIQQVVKLRGSSMRGYVPPAPEEGHQGLNTVMLEVRGQSVDHEKRLRALQAAEKQRRKELEERTDDFADELAGFVEGKALRKTGGHMEAERIRSRRDKATLNAMFGNGDEMGGAPTVAGSGSALKPSKFILGKPGAAAPDDVA